MNDETNLIERLKAKDPAAISAFYTMHNTRIRRVARRFLATEWDVEEVVQDVVFTVYRKIHMFHGKTSLWNWVYRITQNAARMHLRSAKRHPVPIESASVEVMLHLDPMAQPLDRPDQVIEGFRALDRMREHFDTLAPMNQKLFKMVDVDGLSISDASSESGLSISAVKARLHRVRVSLRAAVHAGEAAGVVANASEAHQARPSLATVKPRVASPAYVR